MSKYKKPISFSVMSDDKGVKVIPLAISAPAALVAVGGAAVGARVAKAMFEDDFSSFSNNNISSLNPINVINNG